MRWAIKGSQWRLYDSAATAPIQKIIQKKSQSGAWEVCVFAQACVCVPSCWSHVTASFHHFTRTDFSSGMHNLFKGHASYPGRLWPAQPDGRSRTTPMTASPWVWQESTFAAGRRRCGVATWSWCRDDCTSLQTQQEAHSDGAKALKDSSRKKSADTKCQHSHGG